MAMFGRDAVDASVFLRAIAMGSDEEGLDFIARESGSVVSRTMSLLNNEEYHKLIKNGGHGVDKIISDQIDKVLKIMDIFESFLDIRRMSLFIATHLMIHDFTQELFDAVKYVETGRYLRPAMALMPFYTGLDAKAMYELLYDEDAIDPWVRTADDPIYADVNFNMDTLVTKYKVNPKHDGILSNIPDDEFMVRTAALDLYGHSCRIVRQAAPQWDLLSKSVASLTRVDPACAFFAPSLATFLRTSLFLVSIVSLNCSRLSLCLESITFILIPTTVSLE